MALLSLASAGCSQALLGLGASETPAPATTSTLPRIPRVDNSAAAPCWQQRQIAKQNAWFDSRGAGKPVAYEAPCDVDKAKPAQPQAAETPPRTS